MMAPDIHDGLGPGWQTRQWKAGNNGMVNLVMGRCSMKTCMVATPTLLGRMCIVHVIGQSLLYEDSECYKDEIW